MSTVIRSEISEKNKYYISKERYFELKHFCLQYKEWKQIYSRLEKCPMNSKSISKISPGGDFHNIVEERAVRMAMLKNYIELVENAAKDSDPEIGQYIFMAAIEGFSYASYKARLDIPCGRDMFYDRYRKFFYILDKRRF